MKNKIKNNVLLTLFGILYTSIAFVSLFHAIAFFELANPRWIAIILAISFEIGQATVLFSLLTSKDKKQTMPWILMIVLTAVQVFGNVYSSYMYAALNSLDKIDYFTKSILFFVQSPNQEYNQVMISYIIGAILPIVALCMTSMVVRILGENQVASDKLSDKLGDKPNNQKRIID